MRTTEYKWRCDKCGASKVSGSKEWLDTLIKEHQCNPRLYTLVNKIKTEYKTDGKIINNNGGTSDVAEYLGVSIDLSGYLLDEMEDLGLACSANPLV